MGTGAGEISLSVPERWKETGIPRPGSGKVTAAPQPSYTHRPAVVKLYDHDHSMKHLLYRTQSTDTYSQVKAPSNNTDLDQCKPMASISWTLHFMTLHLEKRLATIEDVRPERPLITSLYCGVDFINIRAALNSPDSSATYENCSVRGRGPLKEQGKTPSWVPCHSHKSGR